MCQNKLRGSQGSSGSHPPPPPIFCFCTEKQCQLTPGFPYLRELLHLAALPKDAACSHHGCIIQEHALLLLAPLLSLQRYDRHLLQMPRHTAPTSTLPKSGWSSAREDSQPSSVTLPVICSGFFFPSCCLHKAFQSFGSPMFQRRKNTLQHITKRALQHRPWRGGICCYWIPLLTKTAKGNPGKAQPGAWHRYTLFYLFWQERKSKSTQLKKKNSSHRTGNSWGTDWSFVRHQVRKGILI